MAEAVRVVVGQRALAVLGGEEARDQRQPQVGHSEVAEQQLRIRLSEAAVESWQREDVPDIVLESDGLVRHIPGDRLAHVAGLLLGRLPHLGEEVPR